MIDFLLQRFAARPDDPALIHNGEVFTFGWLRDECENQRRWLLDQGIARSAVVAVAAEFSPRAVGLILALLQHRVVYVPLAPHTLAHASSSLESAQAGWLIVFNKDASVRVERYARKATHPLLRQLQAIGHPGLVLFSSGSTGEPKVALHDMSFLLEKFQTPRLPHRMLAFLLFDHIGGINTLLASLSCGGTLVTTDDRQPDSIGRLIQEFKVDLLPTTPSFLNLFLLSEAHQRYDLSSLQLITYGTEVMPEGTLQRIRTAFPQIRLQQTYGLTEVGILHSKSESSDSLWVKVGGEGFQTRIREGLLEIKAHSAMLGYLNAPSPFTEDGWFRTGDMVEVRGEYVKFLGRQSDLINVGGEKVLPAEVENVLQLMPEVAEAAVIGERSALIGNIVTARVRLHSAIKASDFRTRMRHFCQSRLAAYKIPQKVEIVHDTITSERFKKEHRPADTPAR